MPLYLETWKNLKFDNLGQKKIEKPEILQLRQNKPRIRESLKKKTLEKPRIVNSFHMFSSKISIWHEKSFKNLRLLSSSINFTKKHI